jgi:hypothetical protein
MQPGQWETQLSKLAGTIEIDRNQDRRQERDVFHKHQEKILNGAHLLVKAVANPARLAHLRMGQF